MPEKLFTAIPGVGPELAQRIHDALGVDTLEALEIAVLELIEGVPADETVERSFLAAFSEYVGRLRRHGKISRAEILIVDSEAQAGHR